MLKVCGAETNILLYYLLDKFKGCPLSETTPLSEINLEKNMVEILKSIQNDDINIYFDIKY